MAKNIQDTLRPEYISNYDHELKADTMKDFQGLSGMMSIGFKDGQRIMTSRPREREKRDIAEISEASKALKNQVIANLVSMLDDLKIMPIDTESLTQVFHEHGINMRYLSHVAVSSQVPHVKEICLTEMLARTCKNILNYQLSQLILENKEDFDRFGIVKKQKKIERRPPL